METRGRKRRSSQAELDAAVEAVLAGASYKTAEALTGVPASTVQDYVVRWEFVRRSVPVCGTNKRFIDRVRGSTSRTGLSDERLAVTCDRKRRPGSLSAVEREEIRVGIETGESDDEIASRIGRHRSTIWREIAANGGRGHYQAAAAEERAARAARRPKTPWTERRPWLGRRSRDSCAPRSGRLSRSPTGCAGTTPTSQSGGCLTKPSTRPSSSRPKASCERSSPRACDPAGLADVLAREPRGCVLRCSG